MTWHGEKVPPLYKTWKGEEIIGDCIQGTRYMLRKLWKKKFGPYEGLLLHKCGRSFGNYCCVNLDHVYVGTYVENTFDRMEQFGRKLRFVSRTPRFRPRDVDS